MSSISRHNWYKYVGLFVLRETPLILQDEDGKLFFAPLSCTGREGGVNCFLGNTMDEILIKAGAGKVSLTENDIRTMFQAIIHLKNPSGGIFGYEALCRGPAGSAIEDPTNLFLHAQEQDKLAEVDMMCFKRNLKNSTRFPAKTKIFLNIHPHTLGKSTKTSNEIIDFIRSIGMDHRQFVIELVEQFPVRNIDVFASNIMTFKKNGVQISLDDVGAGYSDFFMLSKIKPDFLKTNLYFTDHIHMNKIKQKVVKAVVELSQELDAKVIAEGIERKDDLNTIQSLGVHMGQGYYFARPASFENLTL